MECERSGFYSKVLRQHNGKKHFSVENRQKCFRLFESIYFQVIEYYEMYIVARFLRKKLSFQMKVEWTCCFCDQEESFIAPSNDLVTANSVQTVRAKR